MQFKDNEIDKIFKSIFIMKNLCALPIITTTNIDLKKKKKIKIKINDTDNLTVNYELPYLVKTFLSQTLVERSNGEFGYYFNNKK